MLWVNEDKSWKTYNGEWKFGKVTGEGEMIESDNSKYIGELLEG